MTMNDNSKNKRHWTGLKLGILVILCIVGFSWFLTQNNNRSNEILFQSDNKTPLIEESKIDIGELTGAEEAMEIIQSKDYQMIMLSGNQALAPNALAKVYYNKEKSKIYLDANGLPTPPNGKIYQFWSLTLEPLTPISIGLLISNSDTINGLYKFEKILEQETLGITLEPKNGSNFPSLSQLIALGNITF